MASKAITNNDPATGNRAFYVIISPDGSLFQDKKDWFATETLKKT